MSISLPKPSDKGGINSGSGHSPSGGPVVNPKLKGKFNDKGEPVIYLSQKDQRRIAKVGKISAVGIFAILGPVGKAAKFVSAALGAVTADFISNHGRCKNGKSLRITGTPGGDAIKEIKCV